MGSPDFLRQVVSKVLNPSQIDSKKLEEIAVILAETAGLEPITTLMDLRSRHSKGYISSGVDVNNGKIVDDMMALNVIEPTRVKAQVIKSATEAATAILKIDDLIAAAQPTKKEKGEEKGEGGKEPEMPKLD